MNKLINNLPLIANASEALDKDTGAAWRIRSRLTGIGVWAANAYQRCIETPDCDPYAMANAIVHLATVRHMLRDVNTNAYTLDFTDTSVAKTLGVDRMSDLHSEAVKAARNKCQRIRSSMRFKEFYNEALNQLEEQRNTKLSRVSEIACLLSDDNFSFNADVASALQNQDINVVIDGAVVEGLSDADLYDEGHYAVERDLESLGEAVALSVEAMWNHCNRALSSAITETKINKLIAYREACIKMMPHIGINPSRLAERAAALDKQLAAAEQALEQDNATMEADMQRMEAELAASAPAPKHEDAKSKRTRRPKQATNNIGEALKLAAVA